ncbi:hypothetical protein [Enterococcus wangshanyuanii]|uniref:Uncharacterized protein n=1 Tax=Enterococcus wangshanyuanii TaxID=2005703 RepID=A0ABQ1PQZ6_9ENTE|nr:hypothetical protein [Enterococcus wangshanyuanii]GGD01590.1 hypothetical protein GCM10011573_33960 [Enterococcus wangshanyuanii]
MVCSNEEFLTVDQKLGIIVDVYVPLNHRETNLEPNEKIALFKIQASKNKRRKPYKWNWR